MPHLHPVRLLLTCLLAALVHAASVTAGEEWVDFAQETHPKMPGNEIQSLSLGSDGRVWICTMSGFGYMQNGAFTTVETLNAKGKPRQLNAWTIHEVSPTDYWVGHGDGALHVEGDKQTDFLSGSTVAPIVPYADGVIWALAKERKTEKNTLMAYADGKWEPIPFFADKKPVDMFRLMNGKIWVVVDSNGVWEVDPGKGADQAVQHLEGYNITTVMMDTQQRVWCGLWGRGVMLGNGSTWTPYLQKEKSAVLTIKQDAKGNIWVATSASGLYRFDRETWTHDLKDEGAINLMATTGDGRLWISSQTIGGLRYWDGKAWQVSLDSPLPMRALIESATGKPIAGGILDGLHVAK